MFCTHMLTEKAEYWWDNACKRMEATDTEIMWENLKTEFLEKYFHADVCSKKKIGFLELKQGNMTFDDYAMKFEELFWFFLSVSSSKVTCVQRPSNSSGTMRLVSYMC